MTLSPFLPPPAPSNEMQPAVDTAAPWDPALDRAEWQRIWLGTQSRAWRSLAIVPGEDRLSTLEVATLLVTLGIHHGEAVVLVDARDTGLHGVRGFLERATWHASRGEKLVFATRSLHENLATVPLARSADAALLCVSLGSTPMDLARESVEQIGKDRFLGSMLLPRPRLFDADPRRAGPPLGLEPKCLPGRA